MTPTKVLPFTRKIIIIFFCTHFLHFIVISSDNDKNCDSIFCCCFLRESFRSNQCHNEFVPGTNWQWCLYAQYWVVCCLFRFVYSNRLNCFRFIFRWHVQYHVSHIQISVSLSWIVALYLYSLSFSPLVTTIDCQLVARDSSKLQFHVDCCNV